MWVYTVLIVLCANALVKGTMYVFINRVMLDYIEGGRRNSTEIDYWYLAGDSADVWCTKASNNCILTINHTFGEENHDLGGDGSWMAREHVAALGLRTTLHSAHNGAHISCECAHDYNKLTIVVRLRELEAPDGVLDLRINSVALRYRQLSLIRSNGFFVWYAYKKNESLKLECQTNLKDVKLVTYNDGKLTTNKSLNVDPAEAAWLRYVVRRNATILLTVNLVFLGFLADETFLTVNTSNSLLELYEVNGDRRVYYYYDDGETLTLQCKATPELIAQYHLYMMFGDTVEDVEYSITKQFQLSANDHGSSVDCTLLDNNTPFRQIRVIFRMKYFTTAAVRRRLCNDQCAEEREPIVEYSHITEIAVISLFVASGMIVTAIMVSWRRLHSCSGASKESVEMARIQTRPLPPVPRPSVTSYEYINPTNQYCEIMEFAPAVHHRHLVSGDPGVQNTMYYWI